MSHIKLLPVMEVKEISWKEAHKFFNQPLKKIMVVSSKNKKTQ